MGNNESSTLQMHEIDIESYTGKRYAQQVPNTREPTRGAIYTTPALPLVQAQQTLYHNFLRGCGVENGTRLLYGERKLMDGKAGAYEWMTYAQTRARVDSIASGLAQICGLKRQEPVGIFSKNRVEWMLSAHACDRMSYMLVPLYDTLGHDAVPFIVNQTELRVLICAGEQFKAVMDCKDACPTLQIVIQFEAVSEEQRQVAHGKGIMLKSFQQIEDLGDLCLIPAEIPTPDDTATLCYTSGTTDNPKGVILTHRNLTCVCETACDRLKLNSSDRHISYLPLAHVFERVVMAAVVHLGASAGFYQGEVIHLLDDMATLQPTVFVSVPRLFNRVYDKITQGVATGGGLKKLLFDQAVAAKKAGLADGRKTHTLWDALVFSKTRQLLGGRVRLIVSGSAPLSVEVKDFLQLAFCCDIIEGYGLSESAALLAVAAPHMPVGAHVGVPMNSALVRLEDVPEMSCTSNDRPRPRGEVLVKGPMVFSGYYKDPVKTAEAFDSDGWFHTGDVGCWNADGTLSIIDRKKNIFKLSQGEYVAAEKLENVYAKSRFVQQIFVYGDSLQNCLVAVVVPDPEVAEAWAQQRGLSSHESAMDQMAHNAAFQAAVLVDMTHEGKRAKLRGFEFVKRIHFHSESFSMANDLITPTFKLKRPQLKQFFQHQIKAMYAQL